ncbi:MAG: methyltransferase family protein [Formosimonas sp.]
MFKFLNIANYPLVLMLVLLAAQLVLGRFVGFAGALGRTTGLWAALCLLIGLLLMLIAAVQFRLRKTTVDPTKPPQHLIQTGLFRFSRNPMYVGMLLILCVQPLLALRPHLFVFTLAFFAIMNYVIIPREERAIAAVFGEQYAAYQAKVRRWL